LCIVANVVNFDVSPFGVQEERKLPDDFLRGWKKKSPEKERKSPQEWKTISLLNRNSAQWEVSRYR